jgi:hypothetical protein
LAGATPEQLGWDKSIHRVDVDGETQHEIEVGKDRYQTVRLLADFRANDIVSRATRVWEAKKMEWDGERYFVRPNTPSVVVKDLWMNGKESQEAITLKRIRFLLSEWCKRHDKAPDASDFTRMDPDPDPDFSLRDKLINSTYHDPMFADDAAPSLSESLSQAPYDRYFPTVLAHGHVKLLDGSLDCSEQLMRPGKFMQLFSRHESNPVSSTTTAGSTAVVSQGSSQAPAKSQRVIPQYRNAVHYRIVIQHIGQRLDEVGDLREVFAGLVDAAIGRRFMSRCTVVVSHEFSQVCVGCSARDMSIVIFRLATSCACRSVQGKR